METVALIIFLMILAGVFGPSLLLLAGCLGLIWLLLVVWDLAGAVGVLATYMAIGAIVVYFGVRWIER